MKKTLAKLFESPVFSASTVFLTALAVRFLIRQDMRFEAGKIQYTVVEFYRRLARFIVEDGFFSIFDPQARAADLELWGHPPGYSLLLAFLFSIFGESNAAIQTVSIFFDALSAVLIFLIARRLFSPNIGLLAGLLAAFCPQFALNSVLYLPDTLAIFPLLLAVYFLISAWRDERLVWIALCGICLGLSCWLRANSLLMPIFFALAVLLLVGKKQKFYFAAVLLFSFAATIAPITIRNAIVYRAFIPLSLGAGQTLLEGIADYDAENRFGIPRTDYGIIKLEAERFGRPDYAETLFGPDGVERDRMRVAQGLRVARENPFWFAGIMFQRALSMTKLERVTVVSTDLPVTSALPRDGSAPVRELSGAEIGRRGTLVSGEARLSELGGRLVLRTDNSKNGIQFSSEPIEVNKNTDYLAEAVLKLGKGRIAVKAVGAETGKAYGFSIVDFEEWEDPNNPPPKTVGIPFVGGRDEKIKISVYNESATPPGSLVEIERIRLFDLGPASYGWTKPFRFLIRTLQKLYITAVMLPLAVFGLIVLAKRKKRAELMILLTIPFYYFAVQSILHTEYRYVMALHYFFFVAAAVALAAAGRWLPGKAAGFIERRRQTILS